MKAKITNLDGKQGEISLPSFFSMQVREDVAQKYYEAMKQIQPYAPYIEAGKQHSASGKMRHARRKWRTAYGHGISRVPRKIFWRRGDQFYWQGAEISSARGGRAAHPPKIAHFKAKKKINKKEVQLALKSAIASTSDLKFLRKRYETLQDIKINLPIIIKEEALKLKTKEFFEFLKKILDNAYDVALKKKTIRAGRGKLRGRKYKSTAGLLLVIGKEETAKFSGIDVRKLSDLEISDLWPLGRLTVYTEQVIKQLGEIRGDKEKEK